MSSLNLLPHYSVFNVQLSFRHNLFKLRDNLFSICNSYGIISKTILSRRTKMFKCPNCNEYTISIFSKWYLIPWKIFMPRKTIRCKKCNALLTVPIWASLVQVALLLILCCLVVIFADSFRYYDLNPKLFIILLFTVYFFLYIAMVPIIKINEDD